MWQCRWSPLPSPPSRQVSGIMGYFSEFDCLFTTFGINSVYILHVCLCIYEWAYAMPRLPKTNTSESLIVVRGPVATGSSLLTITIGDRIPIYLLIWRIL